MESNGLPPPISGEPAGVNRTQLGLLFLSVFIDLFGFGIIIPILPFLATDLGATDFQYGLIIALYSLMQFIFAPIWGTLSDKFGRKPIIQIGLGGSVIGFSIFGLASHLWIVFLARIVAGIFTASTLTVSNAYIADITTPKERGAAFGLLAAAFGLGFALGPAVGGLLADYTILGVSGYAVPSFFAAIMCLINLILAYNLLPESLKPELRETSKFRLNFPIFRTFSYLEYPGVLLFISIFAISSLAFSGYVASFSLYAPRVDSSVDEAHLGYYFTYTGFLLVVSQTFIIRPLIRRFGEENLVKIGVTLIFIGFAAVTFAPNFPWMFVTNTPLIIGISFTNPSLNSLISQRSPKHVQGEILGINQGWSSLMRVFGPLIAGYLLGIDIRYPFYFSAAIFLFLMFYSYTRINHYQKSSLQNALVNPGD